MSESLPPVEGELAEALAALGREDPAPPQIRARVRARLMNAVAVGAVGPAAPAPSPGGLWGKSRLASIAFLAGGVVGAVSYAVLAPRAAPQVVYVDRVAPAPASAAPLAPEPPTAVPVPAPTVPAPATATATVPGPPPPSSQLSAERVLLDEARSALAQGEPARALDRLARHRRTFPAPILGEERDAMAVEALAKAGRRDEAIAQAASFHKRWPDSLFASAVDDAVASVR